MKRFIFLSILIISCLNSYSQHHESVQGKVVSANTQEPIDGVSIYIETDNYREEALTDEKGEFRIEQVPVGRVSVIASTMGYTPYLEKNIMVYSGKATSLEILLEETFVQLDEIIVTPTVSKEKPLNRMATTSVRMLSSEEANRYAGSWGDPSRMVANLAGVSAANDSRNDIVIRGNSPIGLQWRVDGFEIPNPNHFGAMGGTGGPVGMLNNNQLANSDFYTGAFPAEFGNLTSGAFDLRLRNGNNKQHEFIGSIGFNGFELGAEGPLSKKTGASYMVNGRYSFLQVLDMMGVSFIGTNGGVPEYQDISAKFNIPTKQGNLSFVTLLGNSQLESSSDMEEDNWVDGDFGNKMNMRNKQYFVGANYSHRFNTKVRLENRISYQYFDSDMKQDRISFPSLDITPKFSGNYAESRATLSSNLHTYINNKNNITGGVHASVFNTDIKDVSDNLVLHDIDENAALFKAFIQWQHIVSNKFSFTAGANTMLYTLNNDYNIEPRAGFKWKMNKNSEIGFGTGLYSQLQPQQVYFYLKDGDLVNKNLGFTKSWQTVLSHDLQITDFARLKTEVYYQHLYNVPIMKEIPQQSILNLGDDFYNDWDYVFTNEGTGKNYGIEVTFEKFFTNNYYLLLTTSLYKSKYKGFDKIERNTRFAGNFSVNALFGYEWKIGEHDLISANAKIAYMGGKRYIPYTVDYEGADPEYDYSQTYTNQLANYFRCDLNINMKNNFKRFAVEWFIELNNITNHKNIWFQSYNNNRQKEEYMYQYGFMPIGGCKIFFKSR